MGVVSVVKSKKIKLQIPEEEILTEELNKWLEENITKREWKSGLTILFQMRRMTL